MTYHGICCYRNMTTNEGWPFQKTLAYVVGISNRKIVDCIKTLSEYNLIKVATRPRKGGGVANRYIVVGPAKWRALE
ncbi:MAG: hypothetical protein HC875_21155 [Anaerolineales bacterium]|nr:hypothetical protein [Anaerolineales bacterium]